MNRSLDRDHSDKVLLARQTTERYKKNLTL